MPLTAEQLTTELTNRLPDIEYRIAFLNLNNQIQNWDQSTELRVLKQLIALVASLRTAVELPAGDTYTAPQQMWPEIFFRGA